MSSQSIRFWDRIADRYSKRPVPDEAVYQRKLAVTREYLTPDMQVFEFGCGTGSTAIELASSVAGVRATDLSPRMIEIAQGKAESRGTPNVTFECAAFDRVSADEGTFDMVLGHSILHLMPDWRTVIGAVHAMLRPGGVFVSSTACLGDSVFRHLRWVAPICRTLGLIPHVEVFTSAELKQCLQKAGFTIVVDWCPGKRRGVFMVASKAASD